MPARTEELWVPAVLADTRQLQGDPVVGRRPGRKVTVWLPPGGGARARPAESGSARDPRRSAPMKKGRGAACIQPSLPPLREVNVCLHARCGTKWLTGGASDLGQNGTYHIINILPMITLW